MFAHALAAVLGPDRAPAGRRRLLWPALSVALTMYVLTDLHEVTAPLVYVALAVAAAGPVALAHASPLIGWRLAVLATFVTVPAEFAPAGLAWPWHPAQLVVLPGMVLAVALRHRPAVVAWVAVLSCAAMLPRVSGQDAVTVVALVTVVAVTGVQVRRRVVARQTAEQTRRALDEQRILIARELHDVVGNHMSLIAVRAESAPYRLHSRPEEHEAEFTAIAGASRDALNDMRRLVGVLAAGSESPLRALVDRATAAGLRVEAHLTDVALAAEPALAVNRVVQEALSNAARHAPGSTVHLTVAAEGESVRVRVRNTAPTRAAMRDAAPGNGLHGMRRRVTDLGGMLESGPTGDGGFEVSAVVPSRRVVYT